MTLTRVNSNGITEIDKTKISGTAITAADTGTVTSAMIADGQITSAKIADATIVNQDVSLTAAIEGTKISPNFGSQNVVTTGQLSAAGINYPTSGSLSGRNRIINGDMRIDQRNAGAANASTTYGVDRWGQEWTSTGVTLSFQQVSEAPAGFSKSLKVTVSTGSPSFTANAAIRQSIEGFNVADLAWGTASAQSATVSFWVRSSLTGSFGGVVRNDSYDRTYPFSYTISTANTWEFKAVTIPGDTTGTWATESSAGIILTFGLGAISARKATANVWANTVARQPTGSVDLIATTGATWQITGVQLEAGTAATPFERRSYGQELSLCQRYFQPITPPPVRPSAFDNYYNIGRFSFQFSPMRAAPTITTSGNFGGTANNNAGGNYSFAVVDAGAYNAWSGWAGCGYTNGKTLDTAGNAWGFPAITLSAEL
jgi:hypothetical protein